MGTIEIRNLTLPEWNPREIEDENFQRLIASIKDHTKALHEWDEREGFRLAATIAVNRNGMRVIGGSQRVRALQALGQEWVHENDITWLLLEPDSPLEITLNLALNSPSARGRWDYHQLSDLVNELRSMDESFVGMTALSALTLKSIADVEFGAPASQGDDTYTPEEGDLSDSAVRPIILSNEQREAVNQAILQVRSEDEEELTEGEAVARFCEEWKEAT